MPIPGSRGARPNVAHVRAPPAARDVPATGRCGGRTARAATRGRGVTRPTLTRFVEPGLYSPGAGTRSGSPTAAGQGRPALAGNDTTPPQECQTCVKVISRSGAGTLPRDERQRVQTARAVPLPTFAGSRRLLLIAHRHERYGTCGRSTRIGFLLNRRAGGRHRTASYLAAHIMPRYSEGSLVQHQGRRSDRAAPRGGREVVRFAQDDHGGTRWGIPQAARVSG